jgi:small nuclear ribonucleoprotein (snRNP)-like protein
MEPKEDKPSVAKLRSLLNRTTRIKITDGRLFIGQFMCIDHSKNIILSAAHEYRATAKTNSNNNNHPTDGGSVDDSSENTTTTTTSSSTPEAGEDIPLKNLSSTFAPHDSTPNILAAGQSRKKEEEGKSFFCTQFSFYRSNSTK